MARPIKVFEPITSEQIVKIHARAREIGLLEAGLHEMIAALADIPLMTALSKQEAIVLIEQLEGNYERPYPAKPRYSDKVEGDASQLPSYYHVRDIRLMFRQLGWNREQVKTGW